MENCSGSLEMHAEQKKRLNHLNNEIALSLVAPVQRDDTPTTVANLVTLFDIYACIRFYISSLNIWRNLNDKKKMVYKRTGRL